MNNSRQPAKITILYERLSRDDGDKAESDSIANQRQLLETYAERNGFTPYIHVSDDGYSGTNWRRPGWQEVITKIETGEVSALLVKDASRIGRDYIRVGAYREMVQDKGIRLVAVNDGSDSEKGEDDFTPFRDVLSEWYARDTSKKIRSVFKSRMESGYHCTGSIPYGYLHDPDNRQQWIIDEAAAETVRRIFQLVIEGKGVYQIADILAADKVLIPTAHYESIGYHEAVRHSYTDPYRWRGSVVRTILERKEYMGVKILKKTYTDSFKQKKRKETPEDERLFFEGGIPQIVDGETWHNAQRLRRTVRRPAKDGRPPSPLTGILVCADCSRPDRALF